MYLWQPKTYLSVDYKWNTVVQQHHLRLPCYLCTEKLHLDHAIELVSFSSLEHHHQCKKCFSFPKNRKFRSHDQVDDAFLIQSTSAKPSHLFKTIKRRRTCWRNVFPYELDHLDGSACCKEDGLEQQFFSNEPDHHARPVGRGQTVWHFLMCGA